MRKKLIYGVGINNSDYITSVVVNGKPVRCPFYVKWCSMLVRCYSERYQAKRPTYIGCFVCEEWLSFMSFKSWMEKQDWQGKELDKDLLFRGNKIYSPETCVFVDRTTNTFTIERTGDRGEYPLGVKFSRYNKKYAAQCCSPFSKKQEHIGYFNCPYEAHEAWRARKHELACQLALLQTDKRVAHSLMTRYAKPTQ